MGLKCLRAGYQNQQACWQRPPCLQKVCVCVCVCVSDKLVVDRSPRGEVIPGPLVTLTWFCLFLLEVPAVQESKSSLSFSSFISKYASKCYLTLKELTNLEVFLTCFRKSFLIFCLLSDLLSGSLLCEHQPSKVASSVTQSSGSRLQREEAIRGSPSHLRCGQECLSGYASQ